MGLSLMVQLTATTVRVVEVPYHHLVRFATVISMLAQVKNSQYVNCHSLLPKQSVLRAQ